MAKAKEKSEVVEEQKKLSRTSAQTEPSKTTHTVADGERLSDIATKYRLSLNKLLRLNDITFSDVEVGMQLVVE